MMFFLLCFSCKKQENVVIEGNEKVDYKGISTIQLENYINRLYIDLLGREPIQSEIKNWTGFLRNGAISFGCRDSMVFALQMDTTYRIGDSSYRHAYVNRIYQLMKLKYLEGASDQDIEQNLGNINFAIEICRLNGDSIGVEQLREESNKYSNILQWPYKYTMKSTKIEHLCKSLMYNGIYDLINMGSFNFVNASFEDAFNRLPNENEFRLAYDIIEKNEPRTFLGRIAQNKLEYLDCIFWSPSFNESQIRWWYFQYLQKPIDPTFLKVLTDHYQQYKDLEWIQRQILIKDEYAQFN